MWTRSYWVLMTYIKRPLSWLIAAAMVVASIGLYYVLDEKYHAAGNNVLNGDAVRTLAQLKAVLDDDPAKPVKLDYGTLRSEAMREVFPRPRGNTFHIGQKEQAAIHAALESVERLTNVVSLAAGHTVDQATLERIAKFQTLKRLSVFADLGYEPLDLRPLANLTELEELQLGVVARVVSLEPLSELPKLGKLDIGLAMLVHQQGLDPIAKLPHLRVLSLPDLRSYPGLQDTIGTLSQSKSLQKISYGVSWDEAEVIAALQSQVTEIKVKPSKYRPARHIALFFALFAVSIAGVLAIHVVGQFSLPASHMSPSFRAPHYLVAGLLVAALLLLLTALLVSVGANVLAASSLMLATVAVHFWSSTRLPQTNHFNRWNRIATLLIALPAGLLPLAVLASRFSRPMIVEKFLMSGHVVIPLFCIVVATWLSRLAYQNLETRLAIRLERGFPATLSFHDIQAVSLAQRANQSPESPRDCHVEIGLKLPVIAKAALAVTLLSIVLLAFGYDDRGRTAAMMCLGSFVLCVYLTGVKWWKEMPYLAAATTRPPDREGHVDRLMRGIAKDLGGLTPLLIASIIAISLVGGLRLEGIGYRVLSGIVVVASVTLAAYAAILWVVAIRTIIGTTALALACYLPCSMLTMAIALLNHEGATLWTTFGIVLSGGVISAISVAAIVFAKRYFKGVEWARFV